MRGKRRHTFELERFEAISVGDGLTLLRVAGRWRSRALYRVPDPAVVVTAGRGERTLDRLPDPGALPAFADVDPPPWRAGFAMPGDPPAGARYALRTADGQMFELPAPAPAALDVPAGPGVGAHVHALEHQLNLADREHARTEEALDTARRRLEEEIARRQSAEEELEIAGGVDVRAFRDALELRLAALTDTERRIAEIRAALPAAAGPAPRDVAVLAAETARRTEQVGAIESRLTELRAALAGG